MVFDRADTRFTAIVALPSLASAVHRVYLSGGYWVVLQNERVGAADERASQVNHHGHRGDFSARRAAACASPASGSAREARCPAREARDHTAGTSRSGRSQGATRGRPCSRSRSRSRTTSPTDVGRAQRPGPALFHPADRPRRVEPRRLRSRRANRGNAPAGSVGAFQGSDG